RQADNGLSEITVFARRILRIDGQTHIDQHSYLHETTFFTHVTISEAIRSLRNNEVVDAILLHSHDVASEVASLVALARVKAVPLIWYTPRHEPSGKTDALKYNTDDYHYGALTPVFIKRIEALKKLKVY